MKTDENISKFKLGTVIQHEDTKMIGHIVGFTLNCFGEIILRIEWADGLCFDQHPSCLTFNINYEEYCERHIKIN